MNNRQEGRVAVVTGGAAGIGQAYSVRLAHDGAKLVIGDIADAGETIGLVEGVGGEAVGVRCDVSSAEDVHAMAEAAFDAFGKVDILVHNAGIYPISMFADMSFEEWRRVLSVNLDSMFHVCHEFLPGMRERGWGRVLCIASTTFHAGSPGMSHYVASKGGLIGLLRCLPPRSAQTGSPSTRSHRAWFDRRERSRARTRSWVCSRCSPKRRRSNAPSCPRISSARSPFWRPTTPPSSPARLWSSTGAGCARDGSRRSGPARAAPNPDHAVPVSVMTTIRRN